jgi:peptidoglycan/xylan/chitin deacetylase (PgdA/CDA1 family)
MGDRVTRTTVLAYHAVGTCPREQDRHNLFVTRDAFERQMAFLARKRNVVPLIDLVRGRVPAGKPAVAITFDDGYRNVLTEAGPILSRFGFPATVFVPTDWKGRTNGWIEPTTCDLLIMDDDELRASERVGIALESHGHAHIDMAETSADEVERDIVTSLDEIERLTGSRPRYLAYPYGRVARWTPQVAARTGLDAAFTIDSPHRGPHEFGRVQVTPLDSMRTFALKTTGWYLSLRHSRAASAAYRTVKPVVRRVLQRGRVSR